MRIVQPNMTSRRWASLTAMALLAAACGTPDEPIGAPPASSLPTAATDSPTTSTPTQTQTTPTSAPSDEPLAPQPDPDEVHWLVSAPVPTGLRLVDARRELAAGCGELEDCALTVPAAELDYGSDDPLAGGSVRINQTLPVPGARQPDQLAGDVVRIGDRDVIRREDGPGPGVVELGWTEPDGIVVYISSVGAPDPVLDALVASLRPVAPDEWPGAELVEPLGQCVDERTRFAPTVVPDGWVRYVLEARPDGSCADGMLLWMSLVEPGTAAGPGTLVNIVVAPAGNSAEQPGEAIVVDGHPAVVQTSEQADGSMQSSIDMHVGDVVVNAHGNVTTDHLVEILSTVALLDAARWSALADEVVTEP